MKVSTKTQYGLRILLHVAKDTRVGRLAQGKDIAARQAINEPYLEQIMVSLKKGGLIQTVRGRNGGYMLARAPEQITVRDIIEVFEGQLDLVEGEGASSPGNEEEAAYSVWANLRDVIREETGGVTLAQIIERSQRFPDYMI